MMRPSHEIDTIWLAREANQASIETTLKRLAEDVLPDFN